MSRVAGLLEPAYEVGGDCFDYALNDRMLNVADHGRDGPRCRVRADFRARPRFVSPRPARGPDARTRAHQSRRSRSRSTARPSPSRPGSSRNIDVETGAMTWTNAGHPLPLLIRGGRVVGELECQPTPPWGLGVGLGRTERVDGGDRESRARRQRALLHRWSDRGARAGRETSSGSSDSLISPVATLPTSSTPKRSCATSSVQFSTTKPATWATTPRWYSSGGTARAKCGTRERARRQSRMNQKVRDLLRRPVVVAPMAGGPSTPALVSAAAEAGAFAFLAAGYKPAAAMVGEIAAVREATAEPFGVNVFVPGTPTSDALRAQRVSRNAGSGCGCTRFGARRTRMGRRPI